MAIWEYWGIFFCFQPAPTTAVTVTHTITDTQVSSSQLIMNKIKEIQKINERELENGVSIEGSWHADYKDTAYIYIGGLPYNLTEGDILAIFSQYGNPVHINLVRDKETGKSKGFAFLKYEDQRSTILAIDNFNGTEILGRMIRVDHVRYEQKEEEELVSVEQALNKKNKEQKADGEDNDRKEEEESSRHRHRSRHKQRRRHHQREDDEADRKRKDGEDEVDPMEDYLKESSRKRKRHSKSRHDG